MYNASPSGLVMTPVIVPHPTEELKLIKYQKELVRCLFTPGALIYAHQPLWIPVEFSSVQEAKEKITEVTLTGVEYDEKSKMIVCIGEVALREPQGPQSKAGSLSKVGSLSLSKGCSKFPLLHLEGDIPNVQAVLQDTQLFPLPLKIFRLGECTSPSPNVYELSSTVWKKL